MSSPDEVAVHGSTDVSPMVETPSQPDSEDAVPNEKSSRPAKATKVGLNDPCPCGSGKKYKHCCRHFEDEAAQMRAALARIPEGIKETMPHFVNWLVSTGNLRFLGQIKRDAWDLLFLQTLHARCLTELQAQFQKEEFEKQKDPAFLEQQRENLASHLARIDQRIADLSSEGGQSVADAPGNTSPTA
jgi:hypothetical protein